MKIRTVAALACLAAAPAFAHAITLDFEGAAGYVNSIGEFYNGGTDGLGQSGPNLGVSFTSGAVALSNDDLGPYYAGAPTPLTVMYAFDTSATMNVAAGFVGTLGFSYSALANTAGAVNVYSGLNGGGTLLASIDLTGNASTGCGVSFCHFDVTSQAFAGTAHSISFGGAAETVLFDDVTITAVPEPSTWLMLALGLGGLGVAARRRAG